MTRRQGTNKAFYMGYRRVHCHVTQNVSNVFCPLGMGSGRITRVHLPQALVSIEWVVYIYISHCHIFYHCLQCNFTRFRCNFSKISHCFNLIVIKIDVLNLTICERNINVKYAVNFNSSKLSKCSTLILLFIVIN